jgi:hypothetical protein
MEKKPKFFCEPGDLLFCNGGGQKQRGIYLVLDYSFTQEDKESGYFVFLTLDRSIYSGLSKFPDHSFYCGDFGPENFLQVIRPKGKVS